MFLYGSVLFLLIYYVQVRATTIVAARCSNGIVLAADSQSTSGSPVLISSRAVRKVFQLSKSTILCSAGNLPKGDTDFQQLYSALRDTISAHESFFDSSLSTSAIAKVARQLIHSQFNSAHVVVAGWEDGRDDCNYVLCEILPGGSKIDAPLVVAGTGSTLIASLLDDNLNPSVEQITASLGRKESGVDASLVPDATGIIHSPVTHHPSHILAANTPHSALTTEQTLPILKRSLALAAKLDPQTGGDKLSVWVLSKPISGDKIGDVVKRIVDGVQ